MKNSQKLSNFVKTGIGLACIVLLGFFFFFQKNLSHCEETTIRGQSMLPTLQDKEKVYLCRGHYESISDIGYGDIIAFKIRETLYVKRVIGLPGEHILFGKDGFLYRDNIRLHEPYIFGKSFRIDNNLRRLLIQIDRFDGKIPENMLLVLGDNREKSMDSSFFGMIDFEQVVGKVSK